MGLFHVSLAISFLVTLALFHPSWGQNSPQDYLNSHNAARAKLGVAPMIWDTTVAAYAQSYANKRIGDCNLVHSITDYGENLAKGSVSFNGTNAVSMWFAEKPYYDYSSNLCTYGKECLHYTQLAWRDSTRLGCARVKCANGWWFVTCNYDPPGNYEGERPY